MKSNHHLSQPDLVESLIYVALNPIESLLFDAILSEGFNDTSFHAKFTPVLEDGSRMVTFDLLFSIY